MTEERLQEIKDSINLQYKVQEANELHSFNIFTDEEQELVEEIERLNNIIKKVEECIDYYAIENEDFSKFYNNEEMEILKIIGSDK